MVSKKKNQKENNELVTIAKEISLVRILCSNEEKQRRIGVKKLSQWLTSSSQVLDLREDDFNRLWKGLFYCLWMADKPLYQEEVAEKISTLVHCIKKFDAAVLFVRSSLNIIGQEWVGIDQLRMDKTMMLVRKIVRNSFLLLKNSDWSNECLAQIVDCYKVALNRAPDGLVFHLSEVYLNELAKIGGYNLSSDIILELIKPFAEHMSCCSNMSMIKHIASRIFLNLISQSEKGLEHEERVKAWRDRGFPGGTIDVIEKQPIDEENDSEEEANENGYVNGADVSNVLDPRAGNVNVEVPTLNVDTRRVIDILNSLKTSKSSTTKGRKEITLLLQRFVKFSSGDYPLGLHKLDRPVKRSWKNVVKKSARKLRKNVLDIDDDTGGGDDDDDVSSPNHMLGSGVQSTGQWQVTLKDDSENARTAKSNCNGCIRRSPIKWDVVEKTTDANSDDELISHNDSIHVANKRKRKLNKKLQNNHVQVQNKILKLETSDNEEEEEEAEENEIDILIKQDRKSRRTKRGKSQVGRGSVNTSVQQEEATSAAEASVTENSSPAVEPLPPSTTKIVPKFTPPKRKRVYFVLNRNMVQEEREYQRIVRNTPRLKLFDSTKQPEHPIYKDPGIYRSPENPFYKGFHYKDLIK